MFPQGKRDTCITLAAVASVMQVGRSYVAIPRQKGINALDALVKMG
jgi:hypothetical protein